MEFNAWRTVGKNALPSSSPVTSSFTAINTSPSVQVLTPQLTIPHASSPSVTRRQRNSTVAEYLGLDKETELPRFHRSSSPPSAQPPRRKRKRATEGTSNVTTRRRSKASKQSLKDHARQRLVSDEFHATKPSRILTPDPTQKASSTKTDACPSHLDDGASSTFQSGLKECPTERLHAADESHRVNLATTLALSAAQTCLPLESNESHGLEADYHVHSVTEYEFQGIGKRVAEFESPRRPDQSHYMSPSISEEFPLDEGLEDDDLLTLTDEHHTPQVADGLDRMHDASPPALISASPQPTVRGPISQFVSPVSIRTPLALTKLNIQPIVRPPFPSKVRDRSPIIGLTPNCLLRTCFRIGEAINAGRNAAKNGVNVIIELYARVLKSERNETKQHFVLCDLFHTKKPYLEADYDSAIWRPSELHEFDSRVFLSGGNRLCRCILATKSTGKGWKPIILNIWAAKEDDVRWVEGIVNS